MSMIYHSNIYNVLDIKMTQLQTLIGFCFVLFYEINICRNSWNYHFVMEAIIGSPHYQRLWPFSNMGILLQFLGLPLTAFRYQPSLGIVWGEEDIPKIYLLPRVTQASSSNSGELWRVFPTPEFPACASLRLHCSLIFDGLFAHNSFSEWTSGNATYSTYK